MYNTYSVYWYYAGPLCTYVEYVPSSAQVLFRAIMYILHSTHLLMYSVCTVKGHYVDGILHGPGRGRLTSGLSFTGRFNNGFLGTENRHSIRQHSYSWSGNITSSTTHPSSPPNKKSENYTYNLLSHPIKTPFYRTKVKDMQDLMLCKSLEK